MPSSEERPAEAPGGGGPKVAARKPQASPGIVREFLTFLRERKLLWLSPIFIILLLLSVFIFLTEGSALVPFIYAIF